MSADRGKHGRPFVERIAAIFADVQREDIAYVSGQFNDVVILADELVFRFPRSARAAAMLVDEVAVLRAVRPYLSLPIPEPEFGDVMGPEPFVGYRLIPGEPLRRDALAAIDDPARLLHLADQLARFLKELHAVPIDALGEDIPRRDTLSHWIEMYAEIREQLFSPMRPDAREEVQRHFESYLALDDRLAFEPAVRHGDFGAGNILWDPETSAVTGVIDFSFAGIGDPAIDAAAISTFGEPFLQRMFGVYPRPATTLDRARFYRGTYALQEVLDGLRDGDPRAFENGMREYR